MNLVSDSQKVVLPAVSQSLASFSSIHTLRAGLCEEDPISILSFHLQWISYKPYSLENNTFLTSNVFIIYFPFTTA